jgi:hypothetical protein
MSANLFARFARKLHRTANVAPSPGQAVEESQRALLFHRENQLSAFSASVPSDLNFSESDIELVERIITAYREAHKADLGDSMWKAFFASYHRSIHQALMNNNTETVANIFRDPRASDLFYGFDILNKSYHDFFNSKSMRDVYAKVCLDGLLRFSEAIGASPLDNPEAWLIGEGRLWGAEEVLGELQKKSWAFSIPNPFPEEQGLNTSQGIISFRVPQALYQAWRIKQLVNGIDNPRILEIGAGLGRTAYYAYELGLKDYSIVDIPITAASQAYFLGRTLGENSIHLDGEPTSDSTQKVKILSPQTFINDTKSYDLILNADSLTELDISTATAYWQKIKSSANMFLSINHEANAFRVRNLIVEDLPGIEITRSPYWMRRGYVEELIKMTHLGSAPIRDSTAFL